MKHRLTFFKATLFLGALFSFSSCGKSRQITADGGAAAITDAENLADDLSAPTQLWHQTDECIFILFGYGYNDSDFVANMTRTLFQKFGSFDDGGWILPLIFPDDFKRGSKTYITNIENELSDKNVKGIILLGAPENTHKAIARMQDSWGGALPYPVFSFFSQDDIIAMEDSADFVLDKAQKAEINGILEEEEQTYIKEIPDILVKAVRSQILSDAPFAKNAALFDFVKTLAPGVKMERYADPETNLISINHFVIE